MSRNLLPTFTLLLASSPALAQGPDVAIVAAASAGLTDCRYTDVQAYLMASGFFTNVDIIDCVTQTPTLADLQPYASVITWSNTNYSDAVALGDVLADYVDAGGGVVSAVFATTSTSTARQLDGRWKSGGYEVIEAGLGNEPGSASLGMILDPGHPSVQGVAALTASSAFRPRVTTTLVQGVVVAEWDDGTILAAQGVMPNRIDLGVYPPSSNCSGGFWDFTGDGDVLVANSLLAVAGGGGVGSGYCMPNPNATGQPALMSASGSRVAADNDLTLMASGLPSFAFAFFIVSQTQGFVANPGGSSGNLCVSGSVGRYVGPGQIQQSGAAGEIALTVDITMTPQPAGFVSVMPGDTWNFQTWYRDVAGGQPTSNFTDGYSIDFL